MAGTFTSQTAVRPGAYINFIALRNAVGQIQVGDRGVAIVPLETPWGPTDGIHFMTGSEYVSGAARDLFGLDVGSDAGLTLREMFKNAATVGVYRLNEGTALPATAQPQTDVTFTAAYPGTYGDNILVTITAVSAQFLISTFVQGRQVDRQTVSTLNQFIPNGWFSIDAPDNTTPIESAGILLQGGTDFVNTGDAYDGFFKAASSAIWQVAAIPSDDNNVATKAITAVKSWRENDGKKVQAVVVNMDADYEGIINLTQGYVLSSGERITPAIATGYVAGITARASISESNTYAVVPNAVEIINPLNNDQIVKQLQTGMFIFSRRSDLAIVVEKDINSLHTFTEGKSYPFSKNRVIRVLDDIATQIALVFERQYAGRIPNNDFGRALLRSDLVSYFRSLVAANAISEDFNEETDFEILPGNDIESVVANVWVTPVDSMEKLFMTVQVRG